MALHSISERAGRDRRAGSFDVRDWEVQTAGDHVRVGTVRDILVDDADEPRYLDVDLAAFRRRVLVPFRYVAQDPDRAVVWVAGMDKDGFGAIPDYDGDLAKLNADAKAGLLRDDSAAGFPRSAVTADAALTSTRAAAAGAAAADEVDRLEETRAASPRGDSRLARLGELSSYEIADHAPDVRGWEVVDPEDRMIGSVVDLVVDTAAKKVRYLDTELAAPLRVSADESRILIPIARAEFVEGQKALRIDARTVAQVRETARRGAQDRPDGQRPIDAFEGASAATRERRG
jgi:ribosomal 30S subunit maturation factor RimM